MQNENLHFLHPNSETLTHKMNPKQEKQQVLNIRDIFDSVDYLNSINPEELYKEDIWDYYKYQDCINHSIDNVENYKLILERVLKLAPKRVVDVGSNLNQYGFLFANEGIEYIGIEKIIIHNPIETEMIKIVHADFKDVKDQYKDDVIISNLCIGYLYNEVVECKALINGKDIYEELKKNEENSSLSNFAVINKLRQIRIKQKTELNNEVAIEK